MTPGHNDAARKRARAKYGFYKHLSVYFVIMVMLFIINLATSAEYFWSIWPMIGWGIAVALHALRVYVFIPREEQIVDRLTELERHRHG